jgi:hypothetical protein
LFHCCLSPPLPPAALLVDATKNKMTTYNETVDMKKTNVTIKYSSKSVMRLKVHSQVTKIKCAYYFG